MKTGDLIKRFRERAALTQLSLAKKIGLKIPQFISLIENGHSKFPVARAGQMSAALGLSTGERKLIIKSLVKEYEQGLKEGFKV